MGSSGRWTATKRIPSRREGRGDILTIIQRRLEPSRVLNEKIAGITRSEAIGRITRARQNTPAIVRWSFLLFVFSFPFEPVDVGLSGLLSLSRATGLLFFASYVYHHSPLFYRQFFFAPAPRAMWWFLGYVAVYAFNGLVIPDRSVSEFLVRLFTLVQLVVFFWFASSLLQTEELAKHVLLAYSLASVILAIGVLFALPGFSVQGTHFSVEGTQRTTV